MKLSCSTASFWSAMTAPAPSNSAPATTTTFFIGEISVSLVFPGQRRDPARRGPPRGPGPPAPAPSAGRGIFHGVVFISPPPPQANGLHLGGARADRARLA